MSLNNRGFVSRHFFILQNRNLFKTQTVPKERHIEDQTLQYAETVQGKLPPVTPRPGIKGGLKIVKELRDDYSGLLFWLGDF